MGWFSKIISNFTPEKKWLGINWAMGNESEQAARASTKANEEAAAIAAATPDALDTSSLSDDEITSEAQKRLAKLGKYFTSPLGVLSEASTGSQRIFS